NKNSKFPKGSLHPAGRDVYGIYSGSQIGSAALHGVTPKGVGVGNDFPQRWACKSYYHVIEILNRRLRKTGLTHIREGGE
ncbi:MAG TPA: hypothetical protein VFQ43_08670, partial [Nitrososphaera sp.]|nr:hypothetical protein [Nitrososphaera sp.]